MYDYLRKLDCRLQTLYGLILFEYILFECLFECALMYLENRPSLFLFCVLANLVSSITVRLRKDGGGFQPCPRSYSHSHVSVDQSSCPSQ